MKQELTNETKKLANQVFEQIQKEKQDSYLKGYINGIMHEAEQNMKIQKALSHNKSDKLKDAPSALKNIPVAPEPCVNGMDWKTVKDFFQKINEEVDEFKVEVLRVGEPTDEPKNLRYTLEDDETQKRRIAEEAADVCTVLASLMEAMGIGFDVRNEEQRHVNQHNHERGRN